MNKIEKKCDCAQILIADDDPFNVIALEGMLLQLGIRNIGKAFNGKLALEAFQMNTDKMNCKDVANHQFIRAIILDNQMPQMSGIEAAKQIRKHLLQIQKDVVFDLQNLKLILLSGDLHESIHQQTHQDNEDEIILLIKQ